MFINEYHSMTIVTIIILIMIDYDNRGNAVDHNNKENNFDCTYINDYDHIEMTLPVLGNWSVTGHLPRFLKLHIAISAVSNIITTMSQIIVIEELLLIALKTNSRKFKGEKNQVIPW